MKFTRKIPKCGFIKQLPNDESTEQLFNIVGSIGKGSYSDVFLAIQQSDSNFCALKRIFKRRTQNETQQVENEVDILSKCSHVNICRLLNAFETMSMYIIIFEYANNGDLFHVIESAGKFNEYTAATITTQVANAISYLHVHCIVHRDIKPENLLLARDFTIKLADFGLACVVHGPMYKICGTPTYIAPEMLAEKGYGMEVDTWSLGIILHVMLVGYAPWQCPDRRRLFQLITLSRLSFEHHTWSTVSSGT
ncbi:unnamed protein product [Thelazia callipaeda]|uniref:Protein kinase domain-containing protein n=1 Tax=Thelazia callipaeda TaxID=103827 RepID=A0A0N5D064_THECL|nr:unnamed protein product [Thelazia callipaeda]